MVSSRYGGSSWVGGRFRTDFIRQIYIDPTDGIHNGFEGQHVDGNVMIGLHAKILVQGARQQTGSLPRAVVIAKSLVTIEIGLVQFSLCNVVMVGDIWDIHPKIARHFEDSHPRIDKVHAYEADNIG